MSNKDKIILDLCGGMGAWSKPYRDAGYDVRLIETQQTTDVRLYESPEEEIHGILAAPPCTHFAVAGAIDWKRKGTSALLKGLAVVDACLRIVLIVQPQFWCLENPVGRLRNYLGPPKMYFNPYDYGDPYQKKTCLWGEFNDPIKKPVENTEWVIVRDGRKYSRIHHESRGLPKEERTRIRSITPRGFAKAFFEANP